MSGADVLAVMDALMAGRLNVHSDPVRMDAYEAVTEDLHRARAAVAELIEAAEEYYAKHGRPIFGDDRIGAALARCKGEPA